MFVGVSNKGIKVSKNHTANDFERNLNFIQRLQIYFVGGGINYFYFSTIPQKQHKVVKSNDK